MDDIYIVEPKDYSQVVFDDVKESYPINIDLEIYFTLNELLKAAETDFIGIYKVGFTQSKDYFAYQIVNLNGINKENNKGSLVLQADKLPKDDGEFYQFVYVSNGKQIRGASIPFMFKRSYATDYVQIDEYEAVIIKSKETELNETVNEIRLKCINLTEANETYEKMIKENEDMIEILREEISSVKSKCKNLSIENEKLNSSLLKKSVELKAIADSISELKNENKELKEFKDKFENLESENRNLLDSFQRRTHEFDSMKTKKEELEQNANLKESEIEKLRKDKEELNKLSEELQKINGQIIKLETEVDDRISELNKIKVDLKQNESIVSEQAFTIQAILDERDSLSTRVENLTKEKIEIESSRDMLSNELQMTKDKLLAADECKEILKRQLSSVTNQLDKANLKMNSDCETITKLSGKAQNYEGQNDKFIEEIKRLKIEYSTKLEESNGSYFALHVSFGHLENRLKTMTQTHNKELDEQKREIERIKQDSENLKQRVKAGAVEYANLSKKYIKLKSNFDQVLIKQEEQSAGQVALSSNLNESLYSPISNENMMNKIESTPKEQHIDDSGFKNSHLLSSIADNSKIIDKSQKENHYIKNCEICGYIFPTDLNSTIYEEHLNSHYGPSCPVCFLTFRKGFPQNEYEEHVNNHFTN